MITKVIDFEQAKPVINDVLLDIENSVLSTLGPKGKTVIIIDDTGNPQLTKDGITVANSLGYESPLKQAILNLLREASLRVSKKVGDGTTTSMLLAVSFIKRLLNFDVSRQDIEELEYTIDLLSEELKHMARPIDVDSEELEKIIYTSTNNDTSLASSIMEAIKTVGKHGIINPILDPSGYGIQIKYIKGVKFNTKVVASMHDLNYTNTYITPAKVLLVEGALTSSNSIMNLLKDSRFENTGLIIVAKEFSDAIKNIAMINNTRRIRAITLVTAESFSPNRITILQDVANILHTKVYSTDNSTAFDIRTAVFDKLGTIDEYIVGSNEIVFSKLPKEIEEIDNSEIIQELTDKYNKLTTTQEVGDLAKSRVIQFRLNKYVQVANIYISGKTGAEASEILDRVDDALSAYKSAVNTGIVPGGGITLVRAFSKIGKELNKYNHDLYSILEQVIRGPVEHLLSSEINSKNLLDKLLLSDTEIYDVTSGEFYSSDKNKIYDPVGVLLEAIDSAIGITKTILNTNSFLVKEMQ